MREIKFRAKNTIDKWVYGSLVSGMSNNGFEVCFIAESLPVGTEDFEHWNLPMQRVLPNTLGEFTGMTDKTGHDLYEGDIVKVPFCEYDKVGRLYVGDLPKFLNGVVKYNARTVKYEIVFPYENKHHITACEIGWGHEELIIVGNIIDNPELLSETAV